MVKKSKRMVWKSGDARRKAIDASSSADAVLQRAVEYHILETDGDRYRFTALFQRYMLNTMRAVPLEVRDPDQLKADIRRAEVLVILHLAPNINEAEIGALLKVVEAMTQLESQAAGLSAFLVQF